MATYNGANFLREQLDSFAEQKRLPDELVVCDDKSTDETVAILKRFAETAPFPVRVYFNDQNLGYILNFEKALSLARGDLIFLSDQDDVWFAHKLKVFEEQWRSSPSTLLFVCDQQLCDESLNLGVKKSENLSRIGCLPSSIQTGCCTAFRRELLTAVLPMPRYGIPHDNWIHSIAAALDRREYIDEVLQLSRRHATNTSAAVISNPMGVQRRRGHIRLRQIFGVVFRDTAMPMLAELGELRFIERRFRDCESELNCLVGVDAAKIAFDEINAKACLLQTRIEVLKNSRMKRVLPVMKMLRYDRYCRAYGKLSAIKDLIRLKYKD